MNFQEHTMTKTMTFAVVHFSVAFSVAYAMSGSLIIGGGIALIEPAVNTAAYYFHEKIWNKINSKQWNHMQVLTS
jgi:uncharacterized membrane protein